MSSLKKVAIIPLEGDSKHVVIKTGYNPKELSFTKSAGWAPSKEGAGKDFPAMAFTAGEAITMSIEFFFDRYEEAGKDRDVRPEVKKLIHLCEIQTIKGDEKRPPRIQVVWIDSDPIGVGNFIGVVTQAQAKYTMFTGDGLPCRASVTVAITQAEDVSSSGGGGAGEAGEPVKSDSVSAVNNYYDVSNMSPAQVSNTPGLSEALSDKGCDPAKPETYPKEPMVVTQQDIEGKKM